MNNDQIQKGLELDARLVEERILMAKDQKATQAASDLKAFLTKHSWSQKSCAAKLGVSAAQINQFLQNKYKGSTDDLVNKVVHLIDSVGRKDRRVKNKPFIDTTVAKRIGTLIAQTEAFSDDEGKIGLIIGDSGHGKSHCLREYARANRNSIYVELDDAMTSTMIFEDIAEKLGVYSAGNLATITRRLIENLQNRHIIVMLDEASSLKVRQLSQLRQIIAIKSRCPLILAGNSDLFNTIMHPKAYKYKGYESLDQFTSRLMSILNLDKIANSSKDGGLYTPEDIRNLYQYGGIRLTGDAVSALGKICRTPHSGRLRICKTIIDALHTSKVANQAGAIDAALICQAIEEINLPVKARLPIVTGLAVDDDEPSQQAITSVA